MPKNTQKDKNEQLQQYCIQMQDGGEYYEIIFPNKILLRFAMYA
jgi:hypothetical protein